MPYTKIKAQENNFEELNIISKRYSEQRLVLFANLS